LYLHWRGRDGDEYQAVQAERVSTLSLLRNFFSLVLSCLVLSCLVLSCLVLSSRHKFVPMSRPSVLSSADHTRPRTPTPHSASCGPNVCTTLQSETEGRVLRLVDGIAPRLGLSRLPAGLIFCQSLPAILCSLILDECASPAAVWRRSAPARNRPGWVLHCARHEGLAHWLRVCALYTSE
jgi:hypothetical protein